MGVVDDIKSRIDIVDFISSYVPLKKAGRNYKALCPFHAEKTPSFIVFPDTGTWRCFGACATGGDVFAFLMKRENLDFAEALRMLAQRTGVELQPMTPAREAEEEHEAKLFAINEAAAEYFHNLLVSSGEGQRARTYLQGRGIDESAIERFGLGYALDDWHGLENHLRAKGYAYENMSEVGLIIQRDEGDGYYDRFRARLMFPIRDIRGRVIGFGGRVLDDSQPKYMNSPQSVVFDKGSVLFGIDQARGPIRAANQAVIVEGYIDVVMAHQHDIRNVVASMGTALTESQLRTLARLTKRLALALDADAAGSQATMRGLETARASLERDVKPIPVGPGLIRFESSLKVDLRIVLLPEGLDPDQVIRQSREAWEALLAKALPLTDYYFRVVTSELDLSTAKGKSDAVERLKPVLAEIGDPVQRSHYIQRLARLVRIDERDLAEVLSPGARRTRRTQRDRSGPEVIAQADTEHATNEEYVLFLIATAPHLVPNLEADLVESELPSPRPEDFSDPRGRALFEAIWPALRDGEPWEVVQDTLADPTRSYLVELADRLASLPAVADDHVRPEALSGLLRLRQRRLQESLAELRFLCQDAEESADQEAVEQYTEAIGHLTQELKTVHRAMSAKSNNNRSTFPA